MVSGINIKVDQNLCYACGRCVERCIMDNLRLSVGPCRTACPLHLNCQGYIRLLVRGKETEAAEEMRRGTPFGAILGRICSHPCEDKCERGRIDDPVHIRALKRYLAERFPEIAYRPDSPARETGCKAAVIGSGPAGLMAAYHLRAAGHAVTVYESRSKPGGLMRHSIPSYRLPNEVVDQTIEMLRQMGVDFRTNLQVGTDISWKKLEKKHQAIVVAAGAGPAFIPDLPGRDLPQVIDGLTFLHKADTEPESLKGATVVVVGSGNTAVDAAITCRLLGADDVYMSALELMGDIPAHKSAVAEADALGVKIMEAEGAVDVQPSDDGEAMIALSDCLDPNYGQGIYSPRLDIDFRSHIIAQKIVLAVGQQHLPDGWPDGLVDAQTRRPLIDPITKAVVGRNGYFACGDFATGISSVVDAMASGLEAAISADRYLNQEVPTWGRDYWQKGMVREYWPDHSRAKGGPRKELEHPAPDIRQPHMDSEPALQNDDAIREAERCLSCGRSFEMNQTCWYCLPCEVECPVNALEVRIPYLVR